MIDFNERAIPGVTSNFLMQEAYARYDFALKYINRHSKVLDIACGVGYGTEKIGQVTKQAIGLDINKEAISYAQINFSSSATFVVGDASETPFKNGYFDVIVAFEMVEHLNDTTSFFKEVDRLLAKDGILIISTPNKDVHSVDGKPMSPYHTKEFNFDELEKILKKFFSKRDYYAQSKSGKAGVAWQSFMQSQTARRGVVFVDFLGIRKLISREKRETIWKYVGGIFGRQKQESLQTKDFPIKKYKGTAEYFLVVCKK